MIEWFRLQTVDMREETPESRGLKKLEENHTWDNW